MSIAKRNGANGELSSTEQLFACVDFFIVLPTVRPPLEPPSSMFSPVVLNGRCTSDAAPLVDLTLGHLDPPHSITATHARESVMKSAPITDRQKRRNFYLTNQGDLSTAPCREMSGRFNIRHFLRSIEIGVCIPLDDCDGGLTFVRRPLCPYLSLFLRPSVCFSDQVRSIPHPVPLVSSDSYPPDGALIQWRLQRTVHERLFKLVMYICSFGVPSCRLRQFMTKQTLVMRRSDRRFIRTFSSSSVHHSMSAPGRSATIAEAPSELFAVLAGLSLTLRLIEPQASLALLRFHGEKHEPFRLRQVMTLGQVWREPSGEPAPPTATRQPQPSRQREVEVAKVPLYASPFFATFYSPLDSKKSPTVERSQLPKAPSKRRATSPLEGDVEFGEIERVYVNI